MRADKQLPTFFYMLLLYYISTPGLSLGAAAAASSSTTTEEIRRGFSTNPASKSSSSTIFQSLLTDPTGLFSFGFLPLDSDQLDLAVLHVPSSLPVWRAIPARPARWGRSTVLSFNGSLVLSDPDRGVLWSTNTNEGGRLVLLNSSNLQVQKLGQPSSVLWQSFDFPSDTLVQGQNFTSTASLFSPNRNFSMSLGPSYLALFMEFDGKAPAAAMYWKHTPLEAKAQIVQGEGAIYARVEPIGFLGMYQTEKAPVDVLAFDSFNRGVPGLRRLTLESDGNLRAYYWSGSLWVRDFEAISEPCGLPTACGPYGLCSSRQPMCQCLDNSTNGCFPAGSGDLCGSGTDELQVVRRKGVDLANKELLGFRKVGSLEECESSCEHNCSCWGAVYSNSSGFCYRINYPIQTLVEVADDGKAGYFKVRREERGEESGRRRRTGVALLVGGALFFSGAALFGAYRVWERRKKRRKAFGLEGSMAEGLSPGPYTDLSSTTSFRSIELSNSFGK